MGNKGKNADNARRRACERIVTKTSKGTGSVFIDTGIGRFFAYLGMMIVARFLGPTDLGLISLASAIATIASTVVLLGMPEGVVGTFLFTGGKMMKE
ncbi:MAG: hypothetical protein QMD22_06155 [archaeon]|nr:hypothetical protein [archaeon]